jgi:uncharacterized protein YndB with AHSA1/START domain
MLIENQIEIHASPDRVWQVTVDVESWPEWAPAMERIRREDTGDFKVGSTALIKQKQMPETRWTVTALEPGRRFSWTGRALGLDMTAMHQITPGDNSVTSLLQIRMTGWVATLFGPILGPLVQQSLKEENQGLKRYCEVRPDTPAA